MTYDPAKPLRRPPAKDMDEIKTALAFEGEAIIPVGILGSIKAKARLRKYRWSFQRVNGRYYKITVKR